MTQLGLRMIPGAERLLALHQAELPQKNELCGAFWGALALRAAGHESFGEEPIDQDHVGVVAGSVLSSGDHVSSLPPGASGRADYRLAHPVVADAGRSGTAVTGLARALSVLSGEAVDPVPVRGPWTHASTMRLLDLLEGLPPGSSVLANVATRFLWGARATPAAVLGHLLQGLDEGPAPDWDVGHFVGVLGSLHGPGGTLVVVADTYPALGWNGLHLQPTPRFAASLHREGMDPGGVLMAVPAREAGAVHERLLVAGLEVGLWDNGSLDLGAT